MWEYSQAISGIFPHFRAKNSLKIFFTQNIFQNQTAQVVFFPSSDKKIWESARSPKRRKLKKTCYSFEIIVKIKKYPRLEQLLLMSLT